MVYQEKPEQHWATRLRVKVFVNSMMQTELLFVEMKLDSTILEKLWRYHSWVEIGHWEKSFVEMV
jgi:hypothetical protein